MAAVAAATHMITSAVVSVGADREDRRARIDADHADAVGAAGDHRRDGGAVQVGHGAVAGHLDAGEVRERRVGRAVDDRGERRLASGGGVSPAGTGTCASRSREVVAAGSRVRGLQLRLGSAKR